MTIFFTSDMHLGHKNIIAYSNRPFASVEEMDDTIIANYNSLVKPGDTVYDLGDFCFRNPKLYLDRFNVLPIRIKGSHDHDIKEPYMRVIETGYNLETITLCHYAMRSWALSHYGSWHLFGHHHGMLEPYGLSFDVGVDCWDFFPVSLERVREKMATLKPIISLPAR
jgi:calcineurin-like phosphoesterase family protein